MWCEACHSDTTARVSIDNTSLHCATCGGEIRSTAAAAPKANVVHPHDVLARWARDELLSGPNRQPAPAASQKLTSEPIVQPVPVAQRESDRTDAAKTHVAAEYRHPVDRLLAGEYPTDQQHTDFAEGHESFACSPVSQRSIVTSEHSLSTQRATLDAQRAEWLATAGQYLAYAGVAVLTVGGGIVLWSHFAAVPAVTPTGWLLCLLGQMLLFLGVVTLVAAGLEQIRGEVRHQYQQIAAILERQSNVAIHRESTESPDRAMAINRNRSAGDGDQLDRAATSATAASAHNRPSTTRGDTLRRAS